MSTPMRTDLRAALFDLVRVANMDRQHPTLSAAEDLIFAAINELMQLRDRWKRVEPLLQRIAVMEGGPLNPQAVSLIAEDALFCPFDCGGVQYTRSYGHASICPITLARQMTAEEKTG